MLPDPSAAQPPQPHGPPGDDSGGLPHRFLPLAVWLAAAVLGALTLTRGWLPHDAGVLGQASERVLAGELPHRDFYDTYTGGLAFLNAAAFRVLGVSVLAMRAVFFVAWLAWIPVFGAVARRFAGPWTAAAATLLAAAATLPAYPEGMPSWYNLFLATAAVWALLRHHEDGRARWLVAAGAAGGISVLFKITGLYLLAGAGLYLLDEERARASRGGGQAAGGADRGYRGAVLAGLAGVALAVVGVVGPSGDPLMILFFGLPPLAAVGAVAVRVARSTPVPSGERLRVLLRGAGLLAGGAAVPLLVFVIPWVGAGALPSLWEGVFVLPRARFASAAWAPPPLLAVVPALAVGAFLALAARVPAGRQRPMALGGIGALALALALSHTEAGYRALWYLVSGSGVVVALAWGHLAAWRPPADARGVLLLGVFAFHALVQVPFAAPIYALYAFPVMVLAVLAAASQAPPLPRRSLHALVAALLVFFLLRVDTGFVYHLGFRYRPHDQTEALAIPRAAGIRVSPAEKAEYEALVSTVEALDPGPVIYAFPDAPEVYFLTGRANPGPALFDFLDPGFPPRSEEVLARLEERDVRVMVLNRRPLFSGPADGELLRRLEARYPQAREVGRFLVAWRPASEP